MAASPVTITLKSGEKGYLFGVGKNITLVLGNNISLTGISNNNRSLVEVWENGALEMKEGSKISGNKTTTAPSDWGGAAVLVVGGHFTMSGGIIEDNEVPQAGGGVHIERNSTFIMSGGVIRKNKARAGGGISLYKNSTFAISGSAIMEENEAKDWDGGGVLINNNCTFTMTGGIIRKNSNQGTGGGVAVLRSSHFTMEGGTIEQNETANTGGGVAVRDLNSDFIMKGGTIKDNTAAVLCGGGVIIWDSSFYKTGQSVISGNTLPNVMAVPTDDISGNILEGQDISAVWNPAASIHIITGTWDGPGPGPIP